MLCEKFLAFLECQSGVTGEAVADDILSKLVEWQLQPQLHHGPAYDGTGAMAGKSKVLLLVASPSTSKLCTRSALHTDKPLCDEMSLNLRHE